MHYSQNNHEKERDLPSEFRDFSVIWHSYPAAAFYELLNASADVDGPSGVAGQGGEGKLGDDLFLALAEETATVVVMLDGAEGMLAGLLAELCLGMSRLSGESTFPIPRDK